MFELVVASGKGGTGKTSMVGSLADLIGPAVLIDCDVDAANLHLIVPHRMTAEHDFSSSSKAFLDPEICTACGVCVDSCRFEAISMIADSKSQWGVRIEIDPLACEGCGLCTHLCAFGALSFNKVSSGRWFESEYENGPFLHAKLGIAQSNSGRLVSLLRETARKTAAARGLDMILVDGPPGIGCPVIASLTNASYLLIVTEPSLSAIHDMTRLVELAEHFKIKTGICINRYDIDVEISERIDRFAAEKQIPVHGRIPFDPAFTQAQLQGKSYIQVSSPEGVERIKHILRGIADHAGLNDENDKKKFAV
ncbi:MAG TPA: ATP-binding protein [candidate division Zixibacteria bacterium]|nr:ATP-binding protein [candidate division Zixibacteria bacterium]